MAYVRADLAPCAPGGFNEQHVCLQSINVSYVTLVAKKEIPLTAADFRPISLLNCSTKLITKLLAHRLQLTIRSIIHLNQYGFIKSRIIQDCVAWSFEYLHLFHKSKKELTIVKLDFEKAFDKVEHKFILKVMDRAGKIAPDSLARLTRSWLGSV
jgi:hypothetical protein